MKKKVKSIIAAAVAAVILTGGAVYAAGGGMEKSIQVVMNGINLVVDSKTIFDDNILYNGTTYVPIRAVAEALGKEVKWDAETNTAEIGDKDQGFLEKNGIKIYTKTIKYKDAYAEVNLKIPVIEGMKNSEVMNQLNQAFEKKALDFKKESERMIKEVFEESKEQGRPPWTGSVYTEYEALINDNETMSISVTYYQYTGGAHGNYYKETVNLDLVNEKELLLKELFAESDIYKQVLTDAIIKQMNKDRDNLFPETLTDFKATDDLKFCLTDEAIVFYFNPYEIAPYASGIVEYKVSYDSLKDVLNENYAQRL
ncbi:MAG TPA: DUF4163 domain-containing protein [Clostridia bacterium]|nr:DUF4163 domain-containing protein [Clostridia bacterium]